MPTTEKQMKKLYKARKKLDKAQAKYDAIRLQITDGMVTGHESHSTSINNEMLTVTKNQRASITKAETLHFKATVKKKVFNQLFSTSYSLPLTKYNALTDGKLKSKLSKVVKVVDSPLTVTIKEK